jgi:hypothetical protein
MKKDKLVGLQREEKLKKLEEEYTIILYKIIRHIIEELGQSVNRPNGKQLHLTILIIGGSIPQKLASQKKQQLNLAMEIINLLKFAEPSIGSFIFMKTMKPKKMA